MTQKQLYAVVIPTRSQTSAGSDARRNTQTQGVLSSDIPSVKSIAPEPGEETLEGNYSGKFSQLTITELHELFNSNGFGSIPYYTQDRSNPGPEDGYYTPDSISINPIDPRGRHIYQFTGTLIREGRRSSHWRAIETTPTAIDSPWSGNPGAEFAISNLASKVRWVDQATGTAIDATPVRENVCEKGTVEVYDADDAPGNAPTLLFDLPYEREYRTDCRVWDDYNREKELIEPAPGTGSTVGSATVGSATVGEGETVVVEAQWQRVFRTDHEFIGKPIVESGALRLVPDEVNRILRAFRWNDDDYNWDIVQLGASPWRLYDFNITSIGPATIEAHVTFEKEKSGLGYGENYGNNYGGTTGIGEQYALNMVLQRGLNNARFTKPANESESVPTDLFDRLNPITRDQARSAREQQALIPRREVP